MKPAAPHAAPAIPASAISDSERAELRRQGILLTSIEELYN